MKNQVILPQDQTLSYIIEIISELIQLKDIDMILDRILLEARHLTRADASSIYLVKENNLQFSHVQNRTLFADRGAGAERYANQILPIDQKSIVGFCALKRKPVIIADAYAIDKDLPYHFNDSFDRQNNYTTRSLLTLPLVASDDTLVGVMQLINAMDDQKNILPFSDNSISYVQLFANIAAVTIQRGILNRELILRMVKMAELHDPKETGVHVQRVSAYSAEIYQRWAEHRNVPSAECKHYRDLISLAAMMHDAGKVGIPDAILKKPARLTEDEFTVVKKHTIYGAGLFTNVSSELDHMAREIALHHHEKWDGTGYPGKADSPGSSERHSLSGEDIPLAARITGLADVYDALSSSRCYKDSWDDDKVHDIIHQESGRHFDPELVTVFFEITDILQAIRSKFQ